MRAAMTHCSEAEEEESIYSEEESGGGGGCTSNLYVMVGEVASCLSLFGGASSHFGGETLQW
jgi:hypothetical protein